MSLIGGHGLISQVLKEGHSPIYQLHYLTALLREQFLCDEQVYGQIETFHEVYQH